MKAERIETLQGLRALAASLVILFHLPGIRIGIYGVDIFFIISGFIIGYVAEVDSHYFFGKRVFRVVPVYWLGTFVIFAMAAAVPHLLNNTNIDPVKLFKSLFFIPFSKWKMDGYRDVMEPDLPQGWTLNYEMMFYVLVGAALAVKARAPWAWVVAALGSLVALGGVVHLPSVEWTFWTDPIILEFALGLLLYQGWKRWRARLAHIPLWMLAAGIATCLTGMSVFQDYYDTWRPLSMGVPAMIIAGLALSAEGRVRLPRVITRVGDASYSLYLFHVYVLIAGTKLLGSAAGNLAVQLAMAPVLFAVSVAVALVSFALIEKPSNRWLRKRFADRSTPVVATDA